MNTVSTVLVNLTKLNLKTTAFVTHGQYGVAVRHSSMHGGRGLPP